MTNPNAPTHRVYYLEERTGPDGKPDVFWHNVGSCWPNKDGKGFNIALGLPVAATKFVIREISDPPPAPEPEQKGKGYQKR